MRTATSTKAPGVLAPGITLGRKIQGRIHIADKYKGIRELQTKFARMMMEMEITSDKICKLK